MLPMSCVVVPISDTLAEIFYSCNGILVCRFLSRLVMHIPKHLCVNCLGIWEPQLPGTLEACLGLSWDCFTYLLHGAGSFLRS